MKPTLSIIVPIYKVEDYIIQCIDSILNQSYTDFELILVDDGSPDKCGEICDAYALNDKRIIVIHKENGGLSSARNVAIDIAKGTYISFIDSDDFISDDYFENNMNYLISDSEVDMSILQLCIYDNRKNEIKSNFRKLLNSPDEIIGFMMSMDYIGAAWINIYKKKIFNKLRFPEGQIFEDGFILIEIINSVKKVYISDKGIYYYRKRDDSIMSKNKTFKNWSDILTTHLKQLDYCYMLNDHKQLFISKFNVCYLSMIYAIQEYPEFQNSEYKIKFQSYKYNVKLVFELNKTILVRIKLLMLKYIGFDGMILIYKLLKYR